MEEIIEKGMVSRKSNFQSVDLIFDN